jgi:hypothetical protein
MIKKWFQPKDLKVRLWLTVLFIASFFASCDKDDDQVAVETHTAESEVAMEMAFDDVDYITFEGMELSNNIYEARIAHDEGPLGEACVSTSFSLQNGITTIDFGDGCEGSDGKLRKGKIIISHTGRYFAPGSVITTHLENYSVNNIKIEGIRTVTNTSTQRTLTPVFNVRIEGGKLTWPDGTSATREINQTRTWKLSLNPDEIEYYIEGDASGVNRRGITYSTIIDSKLVYTVKCVHSDFYLPSSGKKSIILTNPEQIIEVDYGNGTCDNKLNISTEGRSREIEINFKK